MFRLQGSVNSAQGPALSGVIIYVCNQPVTTALGVTPPAPLATIYSDQAGTQPINQTTAPLLTDGLGNWFFYALTGVYTVIVFDPINRIPFTVFPDQQVVSQGGGSVTSVALTVPTDVLTILGSPIISNGTFAVGKATVNANFIMAGPVSGGPAAWAPRAMVVADLPAGTGTVTSVTLGIVAGALFTVSITGTNPVTTNGTFTAHIDLATQGGNVFIGSPADGSTGNMTARRIVPKDLPQQLVVTVAASLTLDASLNSSFRVLINQNVTSVVVNNPTPGQIITFIIKQDPTGGWTWAWPANFKGQSAIAPDANLRSTQSFMYDGVDNLWCATGPGTTSS